MRNLSCRPEVGESKPDLTAVCGIQALGQRLWVTGLTADSKVVVHRVVALGGHYFVVAKFNETWPTKILSQVK